MRPPDAQAAGTHHELTVTGLARGTTNPYLQTDTTQRVSKHCFQARKMQQHHEAHIYTHPYPTALGVSIYVKGMLTEAQAHPSVKASTVKHYCGVKWSLSAWKPCCRYKSTKQSRRYQASQSHLHNSVRTPVGRETSRHCSAQRSTRGRPTTGPTHTKGQKKCSGRPLLRDV